MFWTANFVGPNELNVNNLLKEENLKLTQLLDADDILQECRSDNKALIEYLTKPEILTELVNLITEEPPKDVELTLQYRHANMACEVLTSQMSALNTRLLADQALMNKICDFVNQEEPLNPLLASYFSKTIEMLLDKNPQQDWCLHRIVCLQVVEAFRARRDFLPNLLRHTATSAIADVFRVFIRLKENVVVEWLKEHRFLESLIQIICGTYVPEEIQRAPSPVTSQSNHDGRGEGSAEAGEAVVQQGEEAADTTGAGGEPGAPAGTVNTEPVETGAVETGPVNTGAVETGPVETGADLRARRLGAVAAANASALLCDVIRTGCVKDVSDYYRSGTAGWLRARLAGAADEILRCVFSSPRDRREQALLGAGDLLLELLMAGGELEAARGGVERAAAPHLPLLHQELLQPARPHHLGGGGGGGGGGVVGAARLQAAALLARLAASAVHEVPATMLTLGTPGVLVDMFFKFSENNFLHERLLALVQHALGNTPYAERFARHFIEECDLLNRLMDAFEEIDKLKGTGKPRPGYSGHVTRLLALLGGWLGGAGWLQGGQVAAGGPSWLQGGLAARWESFAQEQLGPRLTLLDTPLLGYYPSESDDYDAEPDAGYDLEESAEPCADLDLDAMTNYLTSAYFLEHGSCEDRNAALDEMFAPPASAGAATGDDDTKDPWESSSSSTAGATEGWAQFDSAFDSGPRPAGAQTGPPRASGPPTGSRPGPSREEVLARRRKMLEDEFTPFWSYKDCEGGEGGGDANASDLQEAMENMHISPSPSPRPPSPSPAPSPGSLLHAASTAELTSNLLTAISSLAPAQVADLVYCGEQRAREHTEQSKDLQSAEEGSSLVSGPRKRTHEDEDMTIRNEDCSSERKDGTRESKVDTSVREVDTRDPEVDTSEREVNTSELKGATSEREGTSELNDGTSERKDDTSECEIDTTEQKERTSELNDATNVREENPSEIEHGTSEPEGKPSKPEQSTSEPNVTVAPVEER